MADKYDNQIIICDFFLHFYAFLQNIWYKVIALVFCNEFIRGEIF